MNDEIFEKLKNFVVDQRWNYSFELKRTTKVEKELRITGDDAVEFILAFGKEFNIDVSNFMMDEYFEPEGDKILPAIVRFLFGLKKRKNKELLLGDLEKAILTGKLDYNVLGSNKELHNN